MFHMSKKKKKKKEKEKKNVARMQVKHLLNVNSLGIIWDLVFYF